MIGACKAFFYFQFAFLKLSTMTCTCVQCISKFHVPLSHTCIMFIFIIVVLAVPKDTTIFNALVLK